MFEHGFIQEEEYISRLAALGISTPSKEKPQSVNQQPRQQQKPAQPKTNPSPYTYVAPAKREEPSPIISEPKPIVSESKTEVPVKTETKSQISNTPIPMPIISVPKQVGKTMVFTSSLVIMPPPEQWKGKR